MPKNTYTGKIMKLIKSIEYQETWKKIKAVTTRIIKMDINIRIKIEERGNP
jgi:hypothetical protein